MSQNKKKKAYKSRSENRLFMTYLKKYSESRVFELGLCPLWVQFIDLYGNLLSLCWKCTDVRPLPDSRLLITFYFGMTVCTINLNNLDPLSTRRHVCNFNPDPIIMFCTRLKKAVPFLAQFVFAKPLLSCRKKIIICSSDL